MSPTGRIREQPMFYYNYNPVESMKRVD